MLLFWLGGSRAWSVSRPGCAYDGTLPIATRGMDRESQHAKPDTAATAVQKCLSPLVKTTAANDQISRTTVSSKVPLTRLFPRFSRREDMSYMSNAVRVLTTGLKAGRELALLSPAASERQEQARAGRFDL